MVPASFLLAVLGLTVIVAVRYFLVVGAAWFYLYRSTPPSWKTRQIYARLPSPTNQLFEIKTSLLSSLIFGTGGALLGLFWQLGWTQIYLEFEAYGWFYFGLSFFQLAVVHEFYFYFTHRLLHEPWAFRRFHATHHRSLEPSPWASFSFHPVEAAVQAAFLPLCVLVLPVHPVVLIAYLSAMTISAIVNHLGFEILPAGIWGDRLKPWIITGTHHADHHRFFKSNFGLYVTILDRVFRTQRASALLNKSNVRAEFAELDSHESSAPPQDSLQKTNTTTQTP